MTDPLLLVGSAGARATSLLNVTRARWGSEVDWHHLTLEDRIVDEARWARELAHTLNIDAAPSSLRDLRDAIEELPVPSKPLVCAVDNLELLYLRGVLDEGLVAPTLAFMSTTDTRILWLASITATAWEVIRAADPGVTALARVREVEPLSRDSIEGAILARHQRSGIFSAETGDLGAVADRCPAGLATRPVLVRPVERLLMSRRLLY